jgi:hypothetical protein
MIYNVTINDKVYEVEVEKGKANLLKTTAVVAAPAAAPQAAAPAAQPMPQAAAPNVETFDPAAGESTDDLPF